MMSKSPIFVEVALGSPADPAVLRSRLDLRGGGSKRKAPRGALVRELDWLFAPLSQSEFKRKYWDKKPYHFASEDRSRFKSLLSIAALRDLLVCRNIPRSRLRLIAKNGAELPVEEKQCDPLGIIRHVFVDKGSLAANSISRYREPVSNLVHDLSRCTGLYAWANCYLSPSQGNRALPWHWDAHDVLVLQTEGTKRWHLFEPVLESPLHHQNPNLWKSHFNIQNSKPTQVVDLMAGEALYVPSGVPHFTETLSDEHSLHLSIGFAGPSWHDLLKGLFERALLECEQDETFREHLDVHRWEASPAECRRKMRDLTAKVIDRAKKGPVDEILRIVSSGFGEPDLRGMQRAWDTFQSGPRYRRKGGLTKSRLAAQVIDDEDFSALLYKGRKYCFDPKFREALRFIAQAESFRVESLPGKLNRASKAALVDALMELGFILPGTRCVDPVLVSLRDVAHPGGH